MVDWFAKNEPMIDCGKLVCSGDSLDSDAEGLQKRERRYLYVATQWSLEDQRLRKEQDRQ